MTNKRKGKFDSTPNYEDAAYSSPKPESSSSILNTIPLHNEIFSHSVPTSALTWKDSVEIMDELLQHYNEHPDSTAQLEKCIGVIESVQKRKNKLIEEASSLKNKIQFKIEEQKEALKLDQEDLNEQERHLFKLQNEIANIHKKNEIIVDRMLQVRNKTFEYKKEASQEIEIIDKVEADRVREVPSLKHKISLYANITGIRWDFENEETLKGEVVSLKCTTTEFSNICSSIIELILT